MKTTYLLHGGYLRHENPENDLFMRELQKNVPEWGTVLIVLLARNIEEREERFLKMQARFREQAGGKNIMYICADEERFMLQIAEAHAIHIDGGDTDTLFAVIRRYPEFISAINGKTVGGSSAGAYLLCAWGLNNWPRKVVRGLGVVPVKLHCHDTGDPQDAAALEELPGDMEKVFLPDHAMKTFVV